MIVHISDDSPEINLPGTYDFLISFSKSDRNIHQIILLLNLSDASRAYVSRSHINKYKNPC